MPNAAIAAETYQSGLKNVDPIGAFAQGVQIRQAFERIDLAQQAQRSDDLFKMVQLGVQRQENDAKTELAKQQQQVAWYNAQTNRMNAERAATKASGTESGPSIWSMLKTDENGTYLDPSGIQGAGTPAAPTGGAAPTNAGSADVIPLTTATSSGTPRVLPDSRAGALPLPTAGAPGTLAASPLLPPPGGAAAPAATPWTPPTTSTAAPAPANPGAAASNRLYLGRVGVNAKGQPSLTFEPKKPTEGPPPLPDPAFLDTLNKAYDHLGVQAVPDASTKGGYAFVKKDNLKSDFSVSSLPADVQKTYIEDVNSMISDAAAMKEPSDYEKMKAAGIQFDVKAGEQPTDKQLRAGAQEMIDQHKDWGAAYATAQKEKENDLLGKASVYAKKLNAQFAGKTGYVPRNGNDILREIGIMPAQSPAPAPQQAAPQQNTPPAAPAGRGNVAGNAPAPAGAPSTAQVSPKPNASAPAGGAPSATAPTPAKSAGPAGAMPSDSAAQIVNLQREIASEPDPKVRQQKQNFLDALRQRQPAQPAQPAANPGTATQDPWSMPPKSEAAPPKEDTARREVAVQTWEQSKAKVARALKSTLTAAEIADLNTSDPADDTAGRGSDRIVKQSKWLQEHAASLGIEARDGKPLRSDSPIFVDHEGRTIRLSEIIQAVYQDPRFKASTRESAGGTQSNNAFTVSVGKPTEVK